MRRFAGFPQQFPQRFLQGAPRVIPPSAQATGIAPVTKQMLAPQGINSLALILYAVLGRLWEEGRKIHRHHGAVGVEVSVGVAFHLFP